MKDTNWLMVALSVIGSLVVAIIISSLVVRSELKPYTELKEELGVIKDSLAVQHNHFYITIEKDTIITQKVCIDLSSLSQ